MLQFVNELTLYEEQVFTPIILKQTLNFFVLEGFISHFFSTLEINKLEKGYN